MQVRSFEMIKTPHKILKYIILLNNNILLNYLRKSCAFSLDMVAFSFCYVLEITMQIDFFPCIMICSRFMHAIASLTSVQSSLCSKHLAF